MKSRLTLLAAIAFFLGSCTTGTFVSSTYQDDIYFNPADVPPPVTLTKSVNAPVAEELPSSEKVIYSRTTENPDGTSTMQNYVIEAPAGTTDDIEARLKRAELSDSDTTTYYEDEELQTIINNYYEDTEVDFAYRIKRFHRPYYYDPFYWDTWSYYDPFFYDPYYYSSWHYPSWSWGWGWNSPYYAWSWGYPYHGYFGWGNHYHYHHSLYWNYYDGYYGGWYYNGHSHGGPWYANTDKYDYGRRRSTGTNVYREGNAGRNISGMVANSSARNKSANTRNIESSIDGSSRRTTSVSGRRTDGAIENSSVNASGRRDGTSSVQSATRTKSSVITEKRRTSMDNITRAIINEGRAGAGSSYTRPNSSSQSRTYTRMSTGSSTNSSSSYTKPRVVTNSSGSTKSSSYASPRSTSTYNRSYRSSSTYNRSSSSGSSSRSYSVPSSSYTKSGSSRSYSAPSSSSSSYRSSSSSSSGSSYRSSSSGSYSGGSSRSSVSSGSGSSRSSGSSSSGRRQ